MRFVILMMTLLFSLNALALSDYERETKWADEILPSVLVGDPVYLKQADGHEFLGLYTPADPGKTAVILAHGIGVHPDWGLISTLRQQLPDHGHATLSIQMPILKADAKGDDYPPTFPLAAERLALAVAYLKAQGHERIALVSHSLGSRMSYRYLSNRADPAVITWVALSTPGTEDYGKLTLPVLDLYGTADLPHVLKNAPVRAKGLTRKGSAQRTLAGADHFFNGKDEALLKAILEHMTAVGSK